MIPCGIFSSNELKSKQKRYFSIQKEKTNLVTMFRCVYLCVQMWANMCNQTWASSHHGGLTLLYQYGSYGFYHSQSGIILFFKMLQQ
uniref:Uncharacterized protein n=1 Tax=Ursus americanus TaxID=9643 RepID=A0A452QYF9_URSAM